MEIQEFIGKFADLFDETSASDLTPQTKFHDLDEWSSLEALCVISMADEDFNVQIKNSDLKNCVTIEDLYNLLGAAEK